MSLGAIFSFEPVENCAPARVAHAALDHGLGALHRALRTAGWRCVRVFFRLSLDMDANDDAIRFYDDDGRAIDDWSEVPDTIWYRNAGDAQTVVWGGYATLYLREHGAPTMLGIVREDGVPFYVKRCADFMGAGLCTATYAAEKNAFVLV